MKQGQIALVRFPQTDLQEGKLRPVLVLGQLPGPFEDWLICMISTQLQHSVEGFDEVLQPTDAAFSLSGLKVASVIRVGRLAVVEANVLEGAIGKIPFETVAKLKGRLANWLAPADTGRGRPS